MPSYISGCHVVYGTEPSDVVNDINGEGNDINKGFGGEFVYLVVDHTNNPEHACNHFEILIQAGEDSHRQDLAKGAGGDFRFLVPSSDPNNTSKINSVRLLRSASAVTSPPSGYNGMTGDINKGRGGSYLYLVWSSEMVEPGLMGHLGKYIKSHFV